MGIPPVDSAPCGCSLAAKESMILGVSGVHKILDPCQDYNNFSYSPLVHS
jgi:hypothetical protein